MKFFLDTEFIEGLKPFRIFGIKIPFVKPTFTIQLISIGIVSETGQEYYAISSDYNYNDANDWVKEKVIKEIYNSADLEDIRDIFKEKDFHTYSGKTNKVIAEEIRDFVYKCNHDIRPDWVANFDEVSEKYPIEFYAYFSDYDWVVFCSLFGTMMQLPKGFPMYCRDLKQDLDRIAREVMSNWRHYGFSGAPTFDEALNHVKTNYPYPRQEKEHNALDDARWNFRLNGFLNDF